MNVRDFEQLYENIDRKIIESLDIAAPKTHKIRKLNYEIKPWINEDIVQKIRIRDKHFLLQKDLKIYVI